MHEWDSVAKEWRETKPQVLWRSYSDALHRALFARWLPEGRFSLLLKTDLFDEAVSEGLYGLFASRATGVVGIDVSALTASMAGERHRDLRAVTADVRCTPFVDGVFDVIVSNSTLDHFSSRRELLFCLRELGRILRSRGTLLLTLDNPCNPIVALRNATPLKLWRRLGVVPYPVGATLGRRSVRRALEESGFDIADDTAFMHCPRVLAVAAARLLERHSGDRVQKRFLSALWAFERLTAWPTRFLTGHFIAVKAIKR